VLAICSTVVSFVSIVKADLLFRRGLWIYNTAVSCGTIATRFMIRVSPTIQLCWPRMMLLAATVVLALAAADAAAPKKRNVLYIVFDDLRPDLSPYRPAEDGKPFMHTPHIQKLADTGIVFDRAFVQIAVCSPSRMSFSTGRRPNGTLAWCGLEPCLLLADARRGVLACCMHAPINGARTLASSTLVLLLTAGCRPAGCVCG
jgi:hypothetical protein